MILQKETKPPANVQQSISCFDFSIKYKLIGKDGLRGVGVSINTSNANGK